MLSVSENAQMLNYVLERIKVDGDHLLWTGYVGQRGHISLKLDDKRVMVRRWLYEDTFGEEIQQNSMCYVACGHELCVRPIHLEIKPLKSKRCKNGHLMVEKNLYHCKLKNGKNNRRCRICNLEARRKGRKGGLGVIKKVKEFDIGQIVFVEGIRAKITKFPTRSTVCLSNTDPLSGGWIDAKMTVKELRQKTKKLG